MIVDNYFNDIDVSASIANGTGAARINTVTRFRSTKFILRDSGNDHNYIFVTSNLAANRNITYPVLTADDEPLFKTVAATVFNRTFDSTNMIDGAALTNATATLAKIANIATARILGRTTGGSGVIEELTATQATAMLNVFTDSLKGLVQLSGGGSSNFLRADGTWAAPPGGGGGDSVTINGVSLVDMDLDDATPAPSANHVNVLWQKDASSPANVSAQVPPAGAAAIGVVTTGGQTFAGDKTFNNAVTMVEELYLTGDISPSQITSNQNDYNPTGQGTSTRIRLDSNTSFNEITGLSNGSDGRVLLLTNISNNTVLLTQQNTGSTAAQRVDTLGYDVPIYPKDTIMLIYDSTLSRWTVKDLYSKIMPVGRYGFYYRHDMMGNVADSYSSFGTSGTGAANSVTAVTSTAAHPGVVQHQTGTTTSGLALFLATNKDNILLGNSWYWRYEAMIRVPTLSDGTNRYSITVGFSDSTSAAAPNDCVRAYYEDNTNSGQWRLACESNDTITNNDSSSAVAANTWYRVTVIVYSDNTAELFING